ncbi:MAG TPA: secretion protein HylD, partial [Orrella sp.]
MAAVLPPVMPAAAPKSEPWVKLREDLTLPRGPSDVHGAPTWTLHDPARNQYFSIDWLAFEVLARLSMGNSAAVARAISQDTVLDVDEDEVKAVLQFLADNELTERHDGEGVQFFVERRAQRHKSMSQHLVHSYLFFRVPIL